VLPDWIAGDATLTALVPYRQGLLPSVRAFIAHLALEFLKRGSSCGREAIMFCAFEKAGGHVPSMRTAQFALLVSY